MVSPEKTTGETEGLTESRYSGHTQAVLQGLRIARAALLDPRQFEHVDDLPGREASVQVIERLVSLAEHGKFWNEVKRLKPYSR
jgi:hypothetical protein